MKKTTCILCNSEIEEPEDLITCTWGYFKNVSYHRRCYNILRKTGFHKVSDKYNKEGIRSLSLLITVLFLLVTLIFKNFLYINLLFLGVSAIYTYNVFYCWFKYERPLIKKQRLNIEYDNLNNIHK